MKTLIRTALGTLTLALSTGEALCQSRAGVGSVAGGNPCSGQSDDTEEQNDDCLSAVVPSANPLAGLFVSSFDEDYYSFTVAPYESLTVDVTHSLAEGDIDLELNSADCTTLLAFGLTMTDNESVTWLNASGSPMNVVVRVYISEIWTGAPCNSNYAIASSTFLDPCLVGSNDVLESNDSCLTAAPGILEADGLTVSLADEDYFEYLLLPLTGLLVGISSSEFSPILNTQILDGGDCTTVLDERLGFSSSGVVDYFNNSNTSRVVVLRVFQTPGSLESCVNYNLAAENPVDDCPAELDAQGDHDTCSTALAVSELGSILSTHVSRELEDPDWYQFSLAPGATLTVTVIPTSTPSTGNLRLRLTQGCGGADLATSLSTDTMPAEVVWTNATGELQVVNWIVHLESQSVLLNCRGYTMDVDLDVSALGGLVPFCFGNGAGSACPCGNESVSGHPGGCANSRGQGAVLAASGTPSVAADTLLFELTSASASSFCMLLSGSTRLPIFGACAGCGGTAFDGLRCVGGGLLRYGVRPINAAGEAVSGWGPPQGPPGGIIAFGGHTAGQTQYFTCFYRDDVMASCGFGQNSSNGVAVTIQP